METAIDDRPEANCSYCGKGVDLAGKGVFGCYMCDCVACAECAEKHVTDFHDGAYHCPKCGAAVL